jgi:hypothetical protein
MYQQQCINMSKMLLAGCLHMHPCCCLGYGAHTASSYGGCPLDFTTHASRREQTACLPLHLLPAVLTLKRLHPEG